MYMSSSPSHDSHRMLNHSQSESSMLSRSAADGLLAGLSIRDPSGQSYLSSARQRHHRSSVAPPRPPRSPPMQQRRVVSNPPPLPTTLPTERVVPIIPGLGYHLAQRRAAEINAANLLNPPVLPRLSGGASALGLHTPSPESEYSHAGDETCSDSDECPPTVSDHAGSVRPPAEHATPDQWRDADNYDSPVWASQWSRRGSEATSAGTAGETIERRPSFVAFMAARRESHVSTGNGSAGWGEPVARRQSGQGVFMRRPSSVGSSSRDQGPSTGNGTRRRSSSQYPNFPFPFPGGGRRGSKASLFETLNGGGSVPNAVRRESNVSIRSSEDGDEQDAWDDLVDPDAAELSRRSSYDSSFAFDHGRRSSLYDGPYDHHLQVQAASKRRSSQESVTFGSLPPRTRNASQGSLLAYAIQGRARRASSININNGNVLAVDRRESWQSSAGLMISGSRRQERNMSVDSVGETERIRRFGAMREINRRESEVLEVEWRMREVPDVPENAWASQQDWQQTAIAHGESHWSPSTVATDAFSPVQADAPGLTSSPETSSSEDGFSPNLASDLRSRYIQPAGTFVEDAYAPSGFADRTISPRSADQDLPFTERVSSRHRPQLSLTFSFEEAEVQPATISPRPIDNAIDLASPGQLLAAMLAECAPSDDEEDLSTGSEVEHDASSAEITHAHRVGLSPVVLQGRGHPSSSPDGLAYLSQTIRVVSDSPQLPTNDDSGSAILGTSPVAPLAVRTRPPLYHSKSAPYTQPSEGAYRPRTFDRMAAFLETSPSPFVEIPQHRRAQRPQLVRAPSKTNYRDPLDRRLSDEVEVNVAPPRHTGPATTTGGWDFPWVSEAEAGAPTTPPPARSRRDASTHHLHRKMVTPPSSISVHHVTDDDLTPTRPTISKKISTASLPASAGMSLGMGLPFEHTFLARVGRPVDRPAFSRSSTFQPTSSSSHPITYTDSAAPAPCDASALSHGLCYCGGLSPYGAPDATRRMSKLNASRPQGHYAYPPATPRIPSGGAGQGQGEKDRRSMPVREKEVVKGLEGTKVTRTVPPPPVVGGMLGRWLEKTHRKTASQGTV